MKFGRRRLIEVGVFYCPLHAGVANEDDSMCDFCDDDNMCDLRPLYYKERR